MTDILDAAQTKKLTDQPVPTAPLVTDPVPPEPEPIPVAPPVNDIPTPPTPPESPTEPPLKSTSPVLPSDSLIVPQPEQKEEVSDKTEINPVDSGNKLNGLNVESKKQKRNTAPVVITGLLLLIVTLPLIVFYIIQTGQLSDIRSRAGYDKDSLENNFSTEPKGPSEETARKKDELENVMPEDNKPKGPSEETARKKDELENVMPTTDPQASAKSKDALTNTFPTSTATSRNPKLGTKCNLFYESDDYGTLYAGDPCGTGAKCSNSSAAGGTCIPSTVPPPAVVDCFRNRTSVAINNCLAQIPGYVGPTANPQPPVGPMTGGTIPDSDITPVPGVGPISCVGSGYGNFEAGTVSEPCPGGGYLIERIATSGCPGGASRCWCTEDRSNCTTNVSENEPGQPEAPQCISLIAYKDGNALTTAELADLDVGDVITLAFAPGGAATKVRFRVNSTSDTDWHETTNKNANSQFVWDYTLANATSFNIEAQWFDGSTWH